jgi:hypothetical protein
MAQHVTAGSLNVIESVNNSYHRADGTSARLETKEATGVSASTSAVAALDELISSF